MLRRLGQMFALLAVVTSVINAQCLASCSSQISLTSVSRSAHDCCKHEHVPKPNKERPCGNPATVTVEMRSDFSGARSIPVCLGSLVASLEPGPHAATCGIDLPIPPGFARQNFPSSISILKI